MVVDLQFLRVLLLYFFITVLLFSFTFCLYEDQIGLFDWKRSFVGQIKYVHFDGSTANNKRVLVSSEANVLAALNSRTGSLIWRRVLERSNNTVDKLLHLSDHLISLSGHGRFLRSWEPATGNLIWETNVFSSGIPREAETQNEGLFSRGFGSVDCIFSDNKAESVVVMAENKLKAFSVETGAELWSNVDPSVNIYLVALHNEKDKLFTFGIKNDAELIMQKINAKSGEIDYGHTVDASWLSLPETSCIFIADAVVCADPSDNVIHSLKLESSRVSVTSTQFSSLLIDTALISELKLYLPHSPSIQHSRREFVLQLSKTHSMLLKLDSDLSITLLKEFLEETLLFSSAVGDDFLIMSATISSHSALLNCYNMNSMTEIKQISQTVNFVKHHGKPVSIYTHFFSKKDNTIGYRVMVLSQDHSISLVQHNGRVLWTREESLASITAVEMVELPVSPKQANFEALRKEFGYYHDGKVCYNAVFAMLILNVVDKNMVDC